MADLSKIRIGAARLTFGGVDLGHTLDSIDVEYGREFEDLKVAQYGNTPIDKALTGEVLTIKVKLAEINVDRLNSALPEGDYALGGAADRIGLGRDAGYLLRQDAKQLVLRPLRNVAAGSDAEDVTLYKAVSSEPVATSYAVDGQQVYEVTFTALVDETYGSGRRLGHIGPANVS